MYKIKDIFDIANKNYNLKINKLDNTKEVTAIEKAIRRALKEQGVKAPYEVNKEQAYYLVNVLMKKYFLKKAQKVNPSLILDADAYKRASQEHLSQALTYQEALINVKLDYLIQLLGSNSKETTFFKAVDFKEAYLNYRNHVDDDGLPLPGFTEADSDLRTSKKFFTVIPNFKPAPTQNQTKVSGKKLDF